MALGFRVRYRFNEPGIQGEYVIFQLPIRIGRNPLNNCQIAHHYVSDLHAVIESANGQLWIRDLNSTNGIYNLAGERFPANVPIALGPLNNTFILGRLFHIQIEVFEQDRPPGERVSPTKGSVLGNREAFGFPGPSRDEGPGRPPFVPRPSSPPYARPQGPSENQALPSLAPLQVEQGLPREPRPSAAPPAVGRGTQQFSMTVETMALLGLQELAGSLVPGVPLRTTGDIARLLTKLHDTVEVFCRCFVPLREGYAQFVSQMDLNREKLQRSFNRSQSALKVEVARDPASIASALLDWRNNDFDAPGVVEGIFADLMSHQLALLEGVMRGVQALMEELSPDRIERLLRDERAPTVSAVLSRYRALWKTFETHYEELKNETRTFDLVFGADFAASYREYLSRRDKPNP